MKIRLISTMVLMALVVACGPSGDAPDKPAADNKPVTDTRPAPRPAETKPLDFNKINADFDIAQKRIKNASKSIGEFKDDNPKEPTPESLNEAENFLSNNDDGALASIEDLKKDVKAADPDAAKELLDRLNDAENNANDAVQNIKKAIKKQEQTKPSIDVLKLAKQSLTRADEALTEANKAVATLAASVPATSTASPSTAASPTSSTVGGAGGGSRLFDLVPYILGGLLVFLLIAGIASFSYLRSRKYKDGVNNDILGVRDQLKRQRAGVEKLTEQHNLLVKAVAELRRAIADQQHNPQVAHHNSAYDEVAPPPPPPPRPTGPIFPLSAEDYRGWMERLQRQMAVVRTDFQNDILVEDPSGNGELLLVRDAQKQRDYVVPRVVHFQTKQDFFTYYGKYYECDRPSSGEVWLINPATVEPVPGGWRLFQKGQLEVR